MIYGVMICYNDMPTIVKTIESMYPLVDEIIAVDGKYIDFDYPGDYSTDGTTEYLESVDKVRVIYAAGLQEVEKRNKYLIGEVGDWYLHLDADEVWEGPCEIPLADMGISALHQLKSGHTNGKRIRLFKHTDGLHYEHKHYWLKDRQGQTFALLEKPGNKYFAAEIEGKIIHHDIDRPRGRVVPKRQYYRMLCKRENPIREFK